MSLPNFIFFLIGTGLEVTWLWENAHGFTLSKRLRDFWELPWIRPRRIGVGLGMGAAQALVSLILFSFRDVFISISDPVIGMVFALEGLFLLYAGITGDRLLPRVNKMTILGVQLIITSGLIVAESAFNPLVLVFQLILPGCIVIILALRKRPISLVVKALLYFWYLISLVLLVYQNGDVLVFEMPEWTILDAFLAGAVSFYLLLNAIFAIRFFLIVSSLLLPANHPLAAGLIPRLFSDEQFDPLRFGLTLAVILALIALNEWLHFMSMILFINILVVVSIQFVFRGKTVLDETR